jgi:ParB family chromosome partitioning protein
MSITEIPLSQLIASPRNVRKTDGASIDGLAASIHAHGLLQNLIVSADGKGRFMVEAGQRRHQAMQLLAKTDRLPAEYGVPCQVLDTGIRDSVEASLAENVMRQDMHPADEFDAFKTIIDQGLSISEAAARFGKPELYIKQRLKLANVAPELFALYRKGKADLDQMMALALTDDQEQQLRIWKAAKQDYMRSEHNIRRAITDKELSTTSKVGKYVDIAAYEKAGGTVRRDLFSDGEAFLQDAEIATRVCIEKLERTAEKIRKEGWLWVETRMEFSYGDKASFAEAPSVWKGNKETWVDQVKATAGAVVSIGYNGAEIARGLVRAEDRKAVAKASGGKQATGGKAAKTVRKPGDLTFAATQRLQAEATGILRMQISELPRTALALLASELAARAFYGTSGYGYQSGDQRQWIHIQRESSGRMPGNLSDVIPSSASGKKFAAAEKAWTARLPKKKAELRDWMLQQDFETISKLLSFLVARELDVVDIHAGQKQGAVNLAEASKVDLSEHWAPSVEWLATLPKSAIVEMVTEAAGKVAAAPLAKMKRDQLPKAACALLPKGWLPKTLRPRASSKPPAPAKKTKPMVGAVAP